MLWNLLDSHDTARLLHRCDEDIEKFKLCVGLQLLLPGMPFIYYGDEFGMTGGPDPDCRRGMVWDEAYQNKEVYEWYRKMISLRKNHPALTEGKIVDVVTDDEKGMFRITRELNGERITLLVNLSTFELAVSVNL